MSKFFMKPNLQFFAEPAPAAGTETGNQGQQNQQQTQQSQQQNQNPQQNQNTSVAVDYSKIQQMLEGTLQAKEETALKAYFKQQGLSQEEAEKAIANYKAEKAKNTPDVGAIQSQLSEAQNMAQQAQVEKEATMAALEIGIDVKTIPYVLKLADLSTVVGEDGKVKNDALKEALNKVLEDVPQLKPTQEISKGFQVG